MSPGGSSVSYRGRQRQASECRLYEDLKVGETLPATEFRVTEGIIDRYLKATGDTSPLFLPRKSGRRPAPPTLAAVYTRRAFAAAQPPPGAVLVRQNFGFSQPIFSHDLLRTEASITEKYIKRGARYVEMDTVTTNQKGILVSRGRITRIWPG